MATINKDFKIKNGLVVEGSTATVNGNQVLTENASDQYIIDLIGGETLVTSVNSTQLEVVNGELSVKSGVFEPAGSIDALTTDDISEGTTNKYYTDARVKNVLTTATKTNIVIEEIAGELHITAENGVADSTTDDLTEGSTNKYFTEQRARDSVSDGNGLSYNPFTGVFSASIGSGLEFGASAEIQIDRPTVDTWYDAAGSASDVATDLTNHINDTSTHGVTGDIVGTTDSQDLSNKRFIDTVYFTDGTTINNEGEIAIRSGSHDFDVQANYGDLNLKTTAIGADVQITAQSGDILLSPDASSAKKAYYGSASAENEIATHGYVDNAVSGLAWKQAVNLFYDDSTPTLSGNELTTPLVIDGHNALTVAENGYRILVAYGNDAGIYVYNENPVDSSWTLTRAEDADTYTELVGAAVYVMEGTQYGSTSWVQGNHYLTNFTGQDWTQFSGQGSVTAGTGITVDGLEVSIDRTTVDTWYDAAGTASDLIDDHNVASGVHGVSGDIVGTTSSQTLTNKTIDGGDNTLQNIPNSALDNDSITINGNATALGSSVTLDTDDISEGTAQYFTDQRAKDAITNGLLGSGSAGYTGVSVDFVTGKLVVPANPTTTDEISEGTTNHYYTDSRARTAAIDLLVNHSTQNNISIVEDVVPGNIVITAENGVADSDTDDLAEGTTNLYFTDQRAVDAITNATIYPTIVDINDYRREEAAQQYVANASTVTAHTFTGNKSVKYLARVVGSVSGTLHSQVTEILVTVDGNNNVAVTEYGSIYTSESALASFTADYSGGEYRLRATTVNNGMEVIVAATMLSWAD